MVCPSQLLPSISFPTLTYRCPPSHFFHIPRGICWHCTETFYSSVRRRRDFTYNTVVLCLFLEFFKKLAWLSFHVLSFWLWLCPLFAWGNWGTKTRWVCFSHSYHFVIMKRHWVNAQILGLGLNRMEQGDDIDRLRFPLSFWHVVQPKKHAWKASLSFPVLCILCFLTLPSWVFCLKLWQSLANQSLSQSLSSIYFPVPSSFHGDGKARGFLLMSRGRIEESRSSVSRDDWVTEPETGRKGMNGRW